MNRRRERAVHRAVLQLTPGLRRAVIVGVIAGMLAVAGCGSGDEQPAPVGQGEATNTPTPKPANGY
jgi:hypothetical protein